MSTKKRTKLKVSQEVELDDGIIVDSESESDSDDDDGDKDDDDDSFFFGLFSWK